MRRRARTGSTRIASILSFVEAEEIATGLSRSVIREGTCRLEEVVEIDIGRDTTRDLPSRREEDKRDFPRVLKPSALLVPRREDENAGEWRRRCLRKNCHDFLHRYGGVFVDLSFSVSPPSLLIVEQCRVSP